MTLAAGPTHFAAASLAGLDEPVRRYFAHAIREGAALAPAAHLSMAGRIRIARLWVPFSAEQESSCRAMRWTARVGVGPLTLLRVTDAYAREAARTEGRLFGRRRVFGASGADIVRSAAVRTALDACAFAPAAVLPHLGVAWSAEDEGHIVATWELLPEHPKVRIRIDPDGRMRSVSAERWGADEAGEHGYLPFGGEILGEQRFGDYTVASHVRVGWWFGTPRYEPFFAAHVLGWAPR